MNDNHAEPLLLKPLQAANALCISPRKLWALTVSREIPCVRLGRSVRYRVSTLETYLAEKEDERK